MIPRACSICSRLLAADATGTSSEEFDSLPKQQVRLLSLPQLLELLHVIVIHHQILNALE